MDQKFLNSARMDDWDYNNIYEEKFNLPLTAINRLDVGIWKFKDSRGVDLRRFSYNEDRLLGAGITLFQNTFEKIFAIICDLYQKGLFESVGNPDIYEKSIIIDPVFKLETKLFDSGKDKFFCINMSKNDKPLLFGPAKKAIIIRFNTIADFIKKCNETEIVEADKIKIKPVKTLEKDKRTGRELF
jgi:hypothetical protein